TMIFDKDFHDKAWKLFLESSINRKISDFEFHKYIYGRTAQSILSYFFNKKMSGLESIAIEEQKEKIYRKLCLQSQEFHLADGLPEFLDFLKNNNIPVTIATASALRNMQFFFENLNLNQWFSLDNIIYNDGSFNGKPEPDIYLRAFNLLKLHPSECIVFEDSESGILSAKCAGAGKIIGVSSMLDKKTLIKIGATQVIENYLEFDIFDKKNEVFFNATEK
ncbi:MAG: HAD family phosphatase, partial [Oscillospiraceae bacterium]|nr:HAD family phosphatase [Oscillospiraceae bacterium]